MGGINGFHLKGPYGVVLLFVVGLDGKKGMFHVAIIVMEIAY